MVTATERRSHARRAHNLLPAATRAARGVRRAALRRLRPRRRPGLRRRAPGLLPRRRPPRDGLPRRPRPVRGRRLRPRARPARRARDGTARSCATGPPCFYLWRPAHGRPRADRHRRRLLSSTTTPTASSAATSSRAPAKVDDRARHIAATCCQTGPALLAYRDNPRAGGPRRGRQGRSRPPLRAHGTRRASEHDTRLARGARPARPWSPLRLMLEYVDRAYIADGHPPRRRLPSERVCHETRSGEGGRCSGSEAYNYFPRRALPRQPPRHPPLRPRRRGLRPGSPRRRSSARSRRRASRSGRAGRPRQARCARARGHVRLRGVEGARVRGARSRTDPSASLDASLLQDRVLAPVLGVDDPTDDSRGRVRRQRQRSRARTARAGRDGRGIFAPAAHHGPGHGGRRRRAHDAAQVHVVLAQTSERGSSCGASTHRESVIDGARATR